MDIYSQVCLKSAHLTTWQVEPIQLMFEMLLKPTKDFIFRA